MSNIDPRHYLPDDHERAVLVGRAWTDQPIPGPVVVVVRDGLVIDISEHVATMSDLLDAQDPVALVKSVEGAPLGTVADLLSASLRDQPEVPSLLAPCDLQAVKACGVTFAVSLLERVIEEQAGGDAQHASQLRHDILELIGGDLSRIVPGSSQAMSLKQRLQSVGAWSQYMEVGIGPDAEVFSKAQPLSSVGFGAGVGLHPASQWNNPEPEIVLAADARGRVQGATLGNDVNLRDIEGRSALLLGKAKDNNASCSLGPFIRLFDDAFTMDTVRQAKVSLRIEGQDDDFLLQDASDMREISRDPLELVRQTHGDHHQYPDGFMLFLGTMFSPIADRDGAGQGFTHHLGDRVTISTPSLGTLINHVGRSDQLPPWTYGIRELFAYLRQRAT